MTNTEQGVSTIQEHARQLKARQPDLNRTELAKAMAKGADYWVYQAIILILNDTDLNVKGESNL